MLVRELIEQLSEMPPNLPVVIGDDVIAEFEVHGAVRTGRHRPNKVELVIDSADLFAWAREAAIEQLTDDDV